jgi:hypothetical protein
MNANERKWTLVHCLSIINDLVNDFFDGFIQNPERTEFQFRTE